MESFGFQVSTVKYSAATIAETWAIRNSYECSPAVVMGSRKVNTLPSLG